MTDGGFAPHISKTGILTLTICKPTIRRVAEVGDYVMALAGKSLYKIVGKGSDSGLKLSYLFKITEKVGMADYKGWCMTHAPNKIPAEPNYMGNCQYDENLEYMPGPHGPSEKEHDLGGCFSIVSRDFGAWKFEGLHTLADEEIAGLGIDKATIEDVGRGMRKLPLSRQQIDALNSLMAMAPIRPAARGGRVMTRRIKRSKRTTRKKLTY
jgi:hypothetical protein